MALILLVDDEADIRAVTRKILESGGHEVVEASNGREAVNGVVRGHAFDAVVTDLIMPEMDGFEVIIALRAAGEDLPIVAITGSAFSDIDLIAAKEVGATAMLAKPFSVEKLLAVVSSCLKG